MHELVSLDCGSLVDRPVDSPVFLSLKGMLPAGLDKSGQRRKLHCFIRPTQCAGGLHRSGGKGWRKRDAPEILEGEDGRNHRFPRNYNLSTGADCIVDKHAA